MTSLGLNRLPMADLTAADPDALGTLQTIHGATGRIVAAENLKAVLSHAADWAMAYFRPTFGVVAVLEEADGAAVVQAAHGTGASRLVGVVMPELFAGAMDEVVFDPDLCGSPNPADRARAAEFGTRSCAAVPIVVQGNVVGSLSVVLKQPHLPTQVDLIALSLMAQLVSLKASASPTWVQSPMPIKQRRFQSLLAWIDGKSRTADDAGRRRRAHATFSSGLRPRVSGGIRG